MSEVTHSFIVTISAWTEPGCKNPDNDPNAENNGDAFKQGLPGWCSTKKAGAIFLWLASGMYLCFQSNRRYPYLFSGFWVASFVYLILQWRSGKLSSGGRDPPFQPPEDHHELEGDEEEGYSSIPPIREHSVSDSVPNMRYDPPAQSNPFSDNNQYSAPGYAPPTPQPMTGRPSMDAYGAFSDPAPSGFGSASPNYSSAYGTASPARTAGGGAPIAIPEPDLGPRVSRTMQYADPYAAVHASVAGAQAPPLSPPGYEPYTGYR
jgi:hypothetical protein